MTSEEIQRRDTAAEMLAAAEREFLLAHGWRPDPDDGAGSVGDSWLPPDGYYGENSRQTQSHRTGHAVNSQKQANAAVRPRHLRLQKNPFTEAP